MSKGKNYNTLEPITDVNNLTEEQENGVNLFMNDGSGCTREEAIERWNVAANEFVSKEQFEAEEAEDEKILQALFDKLNDESDED